MGMRKGSVTIKDIAKKTGISITTVSRALSNNPHVRKETRELIQAIARKYNYVPSYRALSLRSNRTHTIGIVVPQLTHEFFSKVIRGAERYAQDNRYKVVLCPSNDSYEREVAHMERLLSGRVDGIIACISNETRDYSHFTRCVAQDVPLVFFDCVVEGLDVPKVVLDDFNAGYQAVKHLVDQGCQHIAYIGGPEHVSVNYQRYLGYKKALSEAGHPLNLQTTVHCPTDHRDHGESYTEQLMQTEDIDGIFAATDILAIAAIRAIKAKGLKVPEDIAVVGFSNWTIGKVYEPTLTTMSQPGAKIGGKAAQALIQLINAPNENHARRIIVESDLLVRQSSTRLTGSR